ncbi:MAG: PEP-CTERM sorting domain-containing protein [Verrucomicrobiota bacterium]
MNEKQNISDQVDQLYRAAPEEGAAFRKRTGFAAATAACLSASMNTADAAPVYIAGPASATLTNAGTAAININFNGDGFIDMRLSIYKTGGGDQFGVYLNPIAGNNYAHIIPPDTQFASARRFVTGQVINVFPTVPVTSFGGDLHGLRVLNTNVNPVTFGQWGSNSDTGFVGISFGAVDGFRAAWIRIHIANFGGLGTSTVVTILDAAFESDISTPIIAGAGIPLPEPSTAALMGLGMLAVGYRGVRRFRQREKEAPTDS